MLTCWKNVNVIKYYKTKSMVDKWGNVKNMCIKLILLRALNVCYSIVHTWTAELFPMQFGTRWNIIKKQLNTKKVRSFVSIHVPVPIFPENLQKLHCKNNIKKMKLYLKSTMWKPTCNIFNFYYNLVLNILAWNYNTYLHYFFI